MKNVVQSMRDIEKIIQEINGSMAIEGMPLTEEDKDRMRLCAGDRKKVDTMISELIEKHKNKEIKKHEQNDNYEFEHDNRHCYKQSSVLKNKLNRKNSHELSDAEREITALRMMDAKINKIKGNFDFRHLCAIHKYLFGDMYPWAGEVRCANITKGNMFCSYEFIESNADILLKQLKNEHNLKETPEHEIPIRLAFYLSEINVLHPFRDGNGRVQRLFIEYLAESIGYRVDFSEVSEYDMIEASAASFLCDYTKMNEIFLKHTTIIINDEE